MGRRWPARFVDVEACWRYWAALGLGRLCTVWTVCGRYGWFVKVLGDVYCWGDVGRLGIFWAACFVNPCYIAVAVAILGSEPSLSRDEDRDVVVEKQKEAPECKDGHIVAHQFVGDVVETKTLTDHAAGRVEQCHWQEDKAIMSASGGQPSSVREFALPSVVPLLRKSGSGRPSSP